MFANRSWIGSRRLDIVRARIFLFLALTMVAIVALAQNDSTNNRQAGSTAKPHPANDSAHSINWDSIYAEIQTGFVQLRPIFQKGCFDCHSDQTHYPWYHVIPGIKQLIDKDIRDAHKRLNMSKGFPFGKSLRPADDLARIKDELEGGDMPPWNYRLMHWNANPSDAERDSVIAWIDSSLKMLAAHGQYPMGIPPGEAPESDGGEEGSDSAD